jgi:hypothetical protein
MILLIFTTISIIIIGSVCGYLLYKKFVDIDYSTNKLNILTTSMQEKNSKENKNILNELSKNNLTDTELQYVDSEIKKKINATEQSITDVQEKMNDYKKQFITDVLTSKTINGQNAVMGEINSGPVNITGDANTTNLNTSGVFNAKGTANITGLLTANGDTNFVGNVNAKNLNTSGIFTSTNQINAKNLNTSGLLTAQTINSSVISAPKRLNLKQSGGSAINFTPNWQRTPDKTKNVSEISNDTTRFKQLMIVGNKSGGRERRVGIWDTLNMNGTLNANGPLNVKGPINASVISAPNGLNLKQSGESAINFTPNWQNTPDSSKNVSEISNDTRKFKQLMIVGNKSGGGKRKVGIWDTLNMNGTLNANGPLNVKGPINANGPLNVKGPINSSVISAPNGLNLKQSGESAINFTPNWQKTPDSTRNVSEISNDTRGFKQLMIVGNKSGGGERRVGIWDTLNMNGTLNANGPLNVKGPINANQNVNITGSLTTNNVKVRDELCLGDICLNSTQLKQMMTTAKV